MPQRSLDCSSITDAELTTAMMSRWPVANGVATIPYSFGVHKSWWFDPSTLLLLIFYPPKDFYYVHDVIKKSVRIALDHWATLSKGKLKFEEDENAYDGIHYYLSDDYPTDSTAALTFHVPNFLGELKQSYILLPGNFSEYLLSNATGIVMDALHILKHESGHAVGLNHLHENTEMVTKLQQTPEGILCSVMPYASEIITGTSIDKCYYQETFNPIIHYFASLNQCLSYCDGVDELLGPLDARSVGLLYGDSEFPFSRKTLEFHAMTMLTTVLFSFMFLGITKSIFEITAPKKMASMLSNLCFLAAAVFYEVPSLAICLFAVTEILKNVFNDSIKKNIPHHMSRDLYDLSSLQVFSTTLALMGDKNIGLLSGRLFASMLPLLLLYGFEICPKLINQKQTKIARNDSAKHAGNEHSLFKQTRNLPRDQRISAQVTNQTIAGSRIEGRDSLKRYQASF